MNYAVFGGGLGDVIDQCYCTSAYRLLDSITQQTAILIFCHNKFSAEIFTQHPRHDLLDIRTGKDAHHRALATNAIISFLAQGYGNRHLVIVNDGDYECEVAGSAADRVLQIKVALSDDDLNKVAGGTVPPGSGTNLLDWKAPSGPAFNPSRK